MAARERGQPALDAPPLADSEFAAAMHALGPFEKRPKLAVAVSGGADSMALCLLAEAWARVCGGSVLALIVDHGLRPASPAEAQQAAEWLAARGIDAEILVWRGGKPASAIPARARQARYRLLADACLRHGILHLFVGHNREDQAETLLLRASGGSGPAGLAGMSGLVETDCIRVLRPLLQVPKQRLRAYLASRGQEWIEDPSNTNPAFARTRARALLARVPAAHSALADAAERYQSMRQRRDEAAAVLLARHCRLHPLGFARLELEMLGEVDEASVDAALARVAATVGGTAYPSAAEKVARLRRQLLAEERVAASLGRCVWRHARAAEAGHPEARVLLVFREARGLPPPAPLVGGSEAEWDGRFLLGFAAGEPRGGGVRLEALGAAGWHDVLGLRPDVRGRIPREAAVTLPALRDADGLLAVPGLGLHREPWTEGILNVRFRPRRSLSGSGYHLA